MHNPAMHSTNIKLSKKNAVLSYAFIVEITIKGKTFADAQQVNVKLPRNRLESPEGVEV
jgi:hypothetical protein